MRKVGKCTAFRSCRRRAKYSVPGALCSKHWRAWFECRLDVIYGSIVHARAWACAIPVQIKVHILTDIARLARVDELINQPLIPSDKAKP